MRSVRIDDTDTIAALLNEGIPHQVVCELPAQLSHLGRYADRITHLKLELAAPPDAAPPGNDDAIDPREEWDAAIDEALLRSTHLSSLALSIQGNSSPDLFEELLGKVGRNLSALTSLELSFCGAPSLAVSAGLQELVSLFGGIDLVCKGPLDCSVVLTALARRTSSEPLPCRLTLALTDPFDTHTIDGLARLPSAISSVTVLCDEDTDLDLFMDGLLEAGVSAELCLVGRTSDGRSLGLQEHLDVYRQAHLERLLQACTRHTELDLDKLLERCQSIPAAGPQLFAWACDIAMSGKLSEVPEVPLALRSYVRALRHADAAFTVCCQIPADLPLMLEDELHRIVSLRLDLGAIDIAGWRMLNHALRSMTNLKVGSFHQAQGTTYDFLPWLCPKLKDTHIDTLYLDLPGNGNRAASAIVGQFLYKPGLKSVICDGKAAASQVLRSVALRGVKPNIGITVYLAPDETAGVIPWLQGLTANQGEKFKLHIHVDDDAPPEVLMADLDQELRSAKPAFAIPDLTVSSRTYQMTPDCPLALSLIRQAMVAAMNQLDAQLGRQAEYIDGLEIAGEFGASIGDGFDRENLSAEEAQIVTAVKGLGTAMRHLGSDPDILGTRDLMNLSSVNTRTRRHVGNLGIRQHDGAVRWLRDAIEKGLPLGEAQARLNSLLGAKVTREVVDTYLDYMVRRLVESVEQGDQLKAIEAGTTLRTD